MKKFSILLTTILISQFVSAQIPYKNPSFADDVIIHSTPERDQRLVAFASSIAGWEYSTYSHQIPPDSTTITNLKSIDDGENWSVLVDTPGIHTIIKNLDLLTTGESIENSFLIRLMNYGNSYESELFIVGLDFSTFQLQFNPPSTPPSGTLIKDGAFINDNLFPATGSSPGSLAMVFSNKFSGSNKDSISIWTSDDAGHHFTTKKTAYSANKYLDKVDISYGHAPAISNGKYFIVWDERDFFTSKPDKIYYSHNSGGFNSAYSTAVNLNTFLTNSKLRNPKIAVQMSSTNNGKDNITAVILAEKYDESTQKTHVVGFVNDKAGTDDNNWKTFSIGDTTHITMQPDIAFNPYDSTFMVVYFDSTDFKIPYLLHKFDFDETPITWNVLSPGINNSDSISNPCPQIKLCYDKHAGAVVWSSDNELGNGVARFDAPFHYYTGTKELPGSSSSLKIYPNPASSFICVDLKNNHEGGLITVISSEGKILKTIDPEGKEKVMIALDDLQDGLYLVKAGTAVGRVVVRRNE